MRSFIRALTEMLVLFFLIQGSNWAIDKVLQDNFPPKIQEVQAEVPTPTPAPTPDPKFISLQVYFQKYNCPLLPYAQQFLDVAAQYSLDWRLLPAISMQESTCGKFLAGNNPFGFGYKVFDSIATSIGYVAGSISGDTTGDSVYYKKANKDPRAILHIYNVRLSYPDDVLTKMSSIDGSN